MELQQNHPERKNRCVSVSEKAAETGSSSVNLCRKTAETAEKTGEVPWEKSWSPCILTQSVI